MNGPEQPTWPAAVARASSRRRGRGARRRGANSSYRVNYAKIQGLKR
jgi:hypothetical protein